VEARHITSPQTHYEIDKADALSSNTFPEAEKYVKSSDCCLTYLINFKIFSILQLLYTYWPGFEPSPLAQLT
jgi:hypothetical protein